ncbi:uncharacterized protein BT62DRAFT_1071960 [Guyanagaster necrorhizus]|uniref:Uncharacterized protein n=1 Tax=Guyanagaster necrorhizus TaxID=856835 RepID=A0A9P8AXM5_9AGAR|nr:uncharacterized protein BT62DRAFT_1071960 [Guyanagaster necrorhizus MCA 3950]KAG7451386.1 hypothetical protein BT62DRAFT_1071960 [Guyanagaster necrorhizus MCA 3950]
MFIEATYQNVYNQRRPSLPDIEATLQDIFNHHPLVTSTDAGDSAIPADALVGVLNSLSAVHNGFELMDSTEIAQLNDVLKDNPGLQVTPPLLVQFYADKTKQHVSSLSSSTYDAADLLEGRGRAQDRTEGEEFSPSSSSDSQSRPSSRGPPLTPKTQSVFDTQRRQRSTPLGNNAPSSWTKRPPAPHRRKSDAGSRSDSENSPNAFRQSFSRNRAPSNPTSPSASMSSTQNNFPLVGSPPSRPHSRAHSNPQSFTSPYRDDDDSMHDTTSIYDYTGQRMDDSFITSVSSLPMPHSSSDSDEEDHSELGLVMERQTTSSTASLEPFERVDAMQKQISELMRRLTETDRALQKRISEHDSEVEELSTRIDELRSELNASKRDEKDLRSKERTYMNQISALENEIAKLSKSLESSRSSYANLQKQYSEQCSASEKYRGDLRQREETIRNLKETGSLHEMEAMKWTKEHEAYEARISSLESELELAQQVQAQLDEQKQENLLLKETIDRMRFDMDEMRNNASSVMGGSSGNSSAANTLSKSLGAELASKIKGSWGLEDKEDVEDEGDSAATTVEHDSDGEDVIQTIITRKKRKVLSRANMLGTTTVEEYKEYSDTSVQYDATAFISTIATQTDLEPIVLTASSSIQTGELPAPLSKLEIVPKVIMDRDIQTDLVEIDGTSRSPSPDEAMASSSSTIIPSTPKPLRRSLEIPSDQPPAYDQHAEHDRGIASDTLKKLHPGAETPLAGVPGGVSKDVVDAWNMVKEAVGCKCSVIDTVIENSDRINSSQPPKDAKRRRNRFYNIMYVVRDGSPPLPNGVVTQAAMVFGASALVLLALGPYMVPPYSVPGGPTYYDRTAWNSFNTMQAAGEGFSPDGTAAVWHFLGRVGGGAARMARGWPT